MPVLYPFQTHPCWSPDRSNIYERIHLPVAPLCNVKCAFCDPRLRTACHTSKPGASRVSITPDQALAIFEKYAKTHSNLKIAAISGPGEPLYNPQTFEVLRMISELHPEVELCLSTNGILLDESVAQLVSLGIKTISVSMSAIRPETASTIYTILRHEGNILRGPETGKIAISKQLRGIRAAAEAGLFVKVNSILIPDLNDSEVTQLAEVIAEKGALLQNIVPLYPFSSMSDRRPPTEAELERARSICERFIKQFRHCAQCRSDVVGIPGHDEVIQLESDA